MSQPIQAPVKKESVTADIWTQVKTAANEFESEWQTGVPAIPLDKLFPLWNEAMKRVHAIGKIDGSAEMCEALKSEIQQGHSIKI